jgi:hypothetical protein
MNAKLFLLGALLIGSAGSGLCASQPAQAQSMACWGGYHVDQMGHCQSDNPILDNRCPAGLTAQVWPNGNSYRCVPIEGGY